MKKLRKKIILWIIFGLCCIGFISSVIFFYHGATMDYEGIVATSVVGLAVSLLGGTATLIELI